MDSHRPPKHEATDEEVSPSLPDDDWVHELIAMTRPGVEIHLPYRGLGDRIVPFEFDDFS